MAKTKVLICPYCGASQPAEDFCRACGGLFDDLSRQATHNDMGPWYIRMANRPFQPGCSYETLIRLIERGQIDRHTILRGPTTKQFWTVARRVPGVAHLLGYCHNCDQKVSADDHGCPHCGVPFGAYLDRNHLGLPDIRPLPWEAAGDDDGESRATAATAAVSLSAGWSGSGDSRGISSFASDSEIVRAGQDGPERGRTTHAASASTHGPVDSGPYDEPVGGRQPLTSERASLPETQASRALRRELARQQRMVTMLAVLVVVAFVLVVISNLDRMAGRSDDRPDANEPVETVPAQPDETPARPERDDTDDGAASDATGPIDDVEDPGVQPAAVSAAQRYEEAEALIEQGEDEAVELDERITAYEKALEQLKAIQRDPSAAELSVNLPELIKLIETELEKLRLRKFFP